MTISHAAPPLHRTALPRLLPPAPADLRAHVELHGPLPSANGLVAALRDAGLSGRGGAAFPVHRKLEAVAEAGLRTGRTPVVVANGCEGEPASGKDAMLLRLAPHLVLDGLRLAAEAVGADRAGTTYLAVERGSGLRAVLESALAERGQGRGQERGQEPGQHQVTLVEVPPRFLSGESSALTGFISGRPALPRFPQPPPRERGVGGAPTLVQNVESLAQLALVARHGAAWFRAVGTPAEPGTMLCTLHDAWSGPRVMEAATGTPLRRLFGLAPQGSPQAPVQAVLVGGYHGSWLPAAALDARLSAADLGVPLGAGVLAALPADRCGLVETARVLRYLALESAGQCGPCLNGLPRIAAACTELARPEAATRRPGLLADLARWSGLVQGRGACHHPDGTVRLLRSALTVFAAEAQAHVAGFCRAADATPLLPVPAEAPQEGAA
ncbi:NADH:ubiquinone oxidoreductase subunit F (NADH-binding) [Streptacidiphilus sp. MAP12-16]|uniref:NADH-ubiquinone oxidoreductase-F iron-sulfur binding region domain-containing protein n=1 Tax=Streptacidiphilus sp. MAP12-16 TaxID=3156300 RepID=UPI0035138F3C